MAAFLSSALWGASHLTSMVNEGLEIGLMLIAMATFMPWGFTLYLCILRASGSLWLPYGLYLGVNLSFSLLGLFFIKQPTAPEWWIGNPAWSSESGLIGVVVWLILALIVYRLTGTDKFDMLKAG